MIRPLLVGLAALAAIIILFRFLENHLIFYPDPILAATPDRIGLNHEEVYFTTSDKIQLHGWFMPPFPPGTEPSAYMLFLHGNAGNISHRLDNLAGLVRCGLAVFIFDYRGFGRSQGRPSEAGTYLDARAAYQYLLSRPGVMPGNTVVFGRSLGGAVAVDLALDSPARALILESTFTSVRDMVKSIFPFIPRCLVSRMYESADKIGRITMPALFIHGQRDDLSPFELGRRLYEAHPGPKDFFSIPGAGHNDTFIVAGSAYYRRLADFIRHPAAK